jgi:hypothetical protein
MQGLQEAGWVIGRNVQVDTPLCGEGGPVHRIGSHAHGLTCCSGHPGFGTTV